LDELEIEPIAQENKWISASDVTQKLFPNGLAGEPDWQRQLIVLGTKMSFYDTNGFIVVDSNPSAGKDTSGATGQFSQLRQLWC